MVLAGGCLCGLAVNAQPQISAQASLSTGAKLDWRIAGPEKPDQHACGDVPPTAYMVVANSADVVNARVLHVIWHKTGVDLPDAIERIIVDTDADKAVGKTPHYAYLHSPAHHSNPPGELIFAICYFDFCSVGKYDLHVTVIWEDTSTDGNGQTSHRRFIERKTLRIDAQGPDGNGKSS
jgi:hypothetical protein